jgi:hypothetical protein
MSSLSNGISVFVIKIKIYALVPNPWLVALEEIGLEEIMNMTGSRLTNLIKGTSDPNGDSCQEDCPVIWLK